MGVIDHQTRMMRGFSRLRQFARYAVGRIVGTTTAENGAFKQLREMEECRHYQRVEINAITQLLVDKGFTTAEDMQRRIADECDVYEAGIRKLWPEITPNEEGTAYAIDVQGFESRCKRESWPK